MSNLDSLPFDILFELLAYLELGDIVRLGKTCKQLTSILHEATLCRRAVEVRRTDSLLRVYTSVVETEAGSHWLRGLPQSVWPMIMCHLIRA